MTGGIVSCQGQPTDVTQTPKLARLLTRSCSLHMMDLPKLEMEYSALRHKGLIPNLPWQHSENFGVSVYSFSTLGIELSLLHLLAISSRRTCSTAQRIEGITTTPAVLAVLRRTSAPSHARESHSTVPPLLLQRENITAAPYIKDMQL